MFFQTKVVIPRMSGQPVNEEQLQFFINGLENALDQIEEIWLKNKNYVAGDKISIADLLAVTELEQPGIYAKVLLN